MNRFRLTVIKDLLGISKNSEYEVELLDRQNVLTGLIISIFHSVAALVILLGGLISGRNFLVSEASDTTGISTFMPYIFIFLMSFFYGYFAYSYFQRGVVTHKVCIFEVHAYIVECITFGVWVSYLDNPGFRGIILLVAEFIFCVAMFTLKPWNVLIYGLGTFVSFVFASDYSRSSLGLGLFIVFLFLLSVCFVLSVVKYQDGLRSAVRTERLMDMNSELTYVSNHDYLTGLLNRHALSKEIRRYIHKDVYVLMTGVDDFNFFNDLYGHQVGDELLKVTASKLEECFNGDRCYLYGDDTYLVIGTEDDREDFQKKLASWISFRECELNDLMVHFTVSGGYVYGKAESKKLLEDMLRQADIRLNSLRHQGKGVSRGFAYEASLNPREILTMDMDRNEDRQTSDMDVLTGLPGMMYFVNKSGIILNNFSGTDDEYAFLYLNIIGMKHYNEAHGFKAGDELLKLVAQALLDSFPHQLVSRFGEDRFVVLANLPDIQLKLTRLIHHVEEAAGMSGITVKAGIYVYENGTDVDRSCDRAKLACNSIHDAYDISCAFFDNRMESDLRKKQFFVEHLDEAIEKGRVYPYYQPILDTVTEKVVGCEALARWNDPIFGLEEPKEFISILEHSHLIHKLDLCMVRHVAEDLSALIKEGKKAVPVTINLSRVDFATIDIVTEVDRIFKRFEIEPKWIHFEITEGEDDKKETQILRELKRLRMLGYEVWMDNFGSALSNLNVLKNYDFDVLKLDMNFLSDLAENEKSAIIVKNVISMAKNLEIKTVAEGVEKANQKEFLENVGCEYIQGFLYSRPVPYKEIQSFLDSTEIEEMKEETIIESF